MLVNTTHDMGAAACKTVNTVPKVTKCSPIVISGPSGCGKSTLLQKLFKEYPDRFGFSVSHTTRQPRPGEENGVHYHFIDREEMTALLDRGLFLEHAQFGGNMYGTSKAAVQNVVEKDKVCILDIELQGVIQVREVCSELNPVFVFVKPPTFETLEERLVARKTENTSSLDKRLKQAKADLAYVSEHPELFNHTIVNDNLEEAYTQFKDALDPFLAQS